MGWYHEDWEYRKEISIDHTRVDANLASFPVLILRTDTDLRDKARTDGRDILFTSSDGETKIAHEVERYTSSSGELIAHVRVPAVSSSVDTKIYIYYGNPDAPAQENPAAVWDDDYIAVYHMDEPDLATREDSTQYNNHATNYSVYRQPGKVGYASWFNGYTSYLRVPDSASIRSIDDKFTCELWISHEYEVRIDHGYCRTPGEYAQGFVVDRHDHRLRVVCFGVGTAARTWYPALDTWHSIGGRYNRSRLSAIIGASEYEGVNATAPMVVNNNGWVIGGVFTDGRIHMHGMIEELRVSRVARSMPWIRASYHNQNDPAAFHTFGPEEVRAVFREETVTSHLRTVASEAVRRKAVGTVRVNSHVGRITSRAFRPDVVDRFVTSHVRRAVFKNQVAETFLYVEDDEEDFATGSLINVEAVTLTDPVIGALVLESTETRDPPSESVNAEDYCSFEATTSPEDEWIAAVHIEDQDGKVLLDSQTPDPSPTGYRDLTELIVECSPGDVLTISVTVDAESANWEESLSWGHTIYTADLVTVEDLYSSDGCPWTHTYQWTVPNEPGNYLVSWWIHYAGFDEPCGTTPYGERQDFTLNIAEVTTAYEEAGERVSPAVDISEVDYVEASRVLFDLNLPAGTDGLIEISTDGTIYEAVESGDSVPFVAKGEVNEHDEFYIRQTLWTNDTTITPELRYFELWITYKPVKIEDRRVPSHVRVISMTADRAGVMQARVDSRLRPLFFNVGLSRATVNVQSQLRRLVSAVRRQGSASLTVTSSLNRIMSRARRFVIHEVVVTSFVSRLTGAAERLGAGIRAPASFLRRMLSFARRTGSGERTVESILLRVLSTARRTASGTRTIGSNIRLIIFRAFRIPAVERRVTSLWGRLMFTSDRSGRGERSETSFVSRIVFQAWGTAQVLRPVKSFVRRVMSRADAFFGVLVTVRSHLRRIAGLAWAEVELHVLVNSVVRRVRFRMVGTGIILRITSHLRSVTSRAHRIGTVFRPIRFFISGIALRVRTAALQVAAVKSHVRRIAGSARTDVIEIIRVASHLGWVVLDTQRVAVSIEIITSRMRRLVSRTSRVGAGIRGINSILRPLIFLARRRGEGIRRITSPTAWILYAVRRAGSGIRPIKSVHGFIQFKVEVSVSRRVRSFFTRIVTELERAGRGKRSAPSVVRRFIFRPITLLAVFIFSPFTAIVEESRTEAKGAMSFDIKQNDTWPPLRAQLVQADREPIPLAGATVHFVMKNGCGEVVIDREAEIIDEEEGRVEFNFQEGDTATAGDFYGEFKVVYPGIPPETVTVPNYKFIRVNIEKALREQVNT